MTGDTPPGHLGCAVPVVENDLLRASHSPCGCGLSVCVWSASGLRMQPKAISGCALSDAGLVV